VLALLDDVDLAGSGAAPIGDIGRSLEEDSPTVVVDLTSGERLAHFAELDSTAPEGSRLTIVRSAAAYPEGHRIGVAFRSLQDAAGAPIDPSPAFRAFRDDIPTDLAAFEDRRPAMEELFAGLEEAGVEREALQLAWSFTVASQENLSERLLHIRDDAFGVLGEGAPTFRVDEVLESGLPEGIARRVKGAVDVPLYLTGSGEPGSRFEYGDDGLPATGGTMFPARYTCQIPRIALDGASGDTRAVVYGHGLLGSAGEAENSQVAKNASTNNMMYCAIDWIGMSASDLANALTILQDLSRFPTLVDRVQQGILNQQFLARAMKHPDGFASDPAFQDAAGASVLVPGEVYFDGNSQGSIIGGAATAISTEWDRAVLGVPGMNYSLLLPRSVDFDSYFAVMRVSYPDPVEHQLIYGVLQMLWDRAETNGYAQHLTSDPYEGTEAHQVALHVGFGDHQVSQYAAEFEARTIGAGLLSPALAAGRHPDAKPYYGLEEPDELPTGQSLLVYFDSGTLAPPSGPITPVESEEFIAECGGLTKDEKERSELCADSHEDPRRSPLAMAQKDAFFRPDGKLVDPRLLESFRQGRGPPTRVVAEQLADLAVAGVQFDDRVGVLALGQ